MTSLDDKVVLITGAGRGIGAATARELDRRGARLLLLDLDGPAVGGVAARLCNAVGLAADVTDAGALERAIADGVELLGGLDAAIANAGIGPVGSVEHLDPALFERTIEVNLLGVYRTLRLSLPHVRSRGGYLLAVASLAAPVHSPLMAHYAASKAGVEAFANALRTEVVHEGVDVGVAYFGWIATEMVRAGMADPGAAAMRRGALPGPMRRDLPPDGAARALADGLERRARVIAHPWWVRPILWARGAVQPLTELQLRVSGMGERAVRASGDLRAAPRGSNVGGAMRVIDCDCGATLQAANDEDLAGQVREHLQAEHPDTQMDDEGVRGFVGEKAYTASDSRPGSGATEFRCAFLHLRLRDVQPTLRKFPCPQAEHARTIGAVGARQRFQEAVMKAPSAIARAHRNGWAGRSSRRTRVTVALTALAALGAVAGPAGAQINEPPAAPLGLLAFPERDFVSAEGYSDAASVTMQLIRNGVVIGTAEGAPDGDGLLEVNHPGGVCWQGSTPDILPGDQILTTTDGGAQDQITVANVTAQLPQQSGQTILVHGTAQDAAGAPLPLGQLEQRLRNPAIFDKNGRRELRADSTGVADGTLAYDAPGSIRWTATYSGLPAADLPRAREAESRILWLGRVPGAANEVTIFEVGSAIAGGPGFPGCPAAARNAVTGSDHPTINAANVGTPVLLSGVSQDATSVTVTVSDGTTSTTPVTVTPDPNAGAQTWTAMIPAAEIAALSDGTVTATGTYLVGGTPIGGASLTILKDTVVPPAPVATPGPGTYASAQSVSLSDTDPAAAIHYTNDGSTPTGASRRYSAPIPVTASQTLRAFAVDPAGNQSPLADFAYVIAPPAGGGPAGAAGGASGGAAGEGAGSAPPAGVAGDPVLGRVTLLRARRTTLRQVRRSGIVTSFFVPEGTRFVRVSLFRQLPAGAAHHLTRKLIVRRTFAVSRPGRHTFRLADRRTRKRLTRGKYALQVAPGLSENSFQEGTAKRFTIR